MAKYELEVEVRPQDADKRQALTSRIDIALATSGCRITAGEYTVIIERKSAAQVRREKTEEEQNQLADTADAEALAQKR